MAITNKGLRTGLNAWVEAAAEWGYQRGLLFGIASPKGRAMRQALNSWCAMVDEREMMRRAGASMRQRGLRAAMNAWAELVATRASTVAQMGRAAAALRQTDGHVGQAINRIKYKPKSPGAKSPGNKPPSPLKMAMAGVSEYLNNV